MCDRCRRVQEEAIPKIIGALACCESAGASLLGNVLLEACTEHPHQPEGEDARRENINQAFLDAYEGSRTEAIALCSFLITELIAIKLRLLDEGFRAGDARGPIARWDEERLGFHLVGYRIEDRSEISGFVPLEEGESKADLFKRIIDAYVADGGSLHE